MNIEEKIEHSENKERLDRLSRRDEASSMSPGYTKFVHVMRLALPLAAIGIFAVLFINPGAQENVIVPVEEATKEDMPDQKIVQNELLNPQFESMDKKNQPYRIIADRAVQGEKNKDLIMLERPVGVITMEDGINVTMRSDTGAYRQDSERFFLQGSVFLNHEEGYSLSSEEAHIDLKESFAWSDKDVKGAGPDIAIDAKGVKANGKTGEIIFTGPARLVLDDGLGSVGE